MAGFRAVRRRIATGLLPAIGLVAAASASAQPNPPQVPAAPAQGPAQTPLDRFGFLNGSQLQVTTGSDDDNLSFAIKLPTGPSQRDTFSLIASTPLHRGDGAMPASLDALANGSRVTARWGRFEIGRALPNARAEATARQAQQRCIAAHPDDPDPTSQMAGVCTDPNEMVHTYFPALYRRYLADTLTSGATDVGLEATVGINDFEWIDPATFGRQQARHTDWSVAGHFAHYFVGTKTAITASASYQRAYEASEEHLLCPPNPANPAADCVTARGAAPSRKEHLLLSAGLRHQFMLNGTLLPLAIAPIVTYDVLESIVGVDVPVYVTPGADGRLTGGVRFGYRSDHDNHFSVSVFMGAAFSILQ